MVKRENKQQKAILWPPQKDLAMWVHIHVCTHKHTYIKRKDTSLKCPIRKMFQVIVLYRNADQSSNDFGAYNLQNGQI